MEKLVELSDHEILIDFTLNRKCRTNTITIRSLSPNSPIAFKIQTSSPHKFLVNPPTGLLPPLSSAAFQIVLKPQPHLPPTFPRSPSDRFLLKSAAVTDEISDHDVSHWFNSNPNLPTYDVKLKVYFVGELLLKYAVENGDLESVKGIVKRQRFVVSRLLDLESEVLYGAAAARGGEILGVLLEAGLRVGGRGGGGEVDVRGKDGRMALWRAAARGERRVVEVLMDAGADPTVGDVEGCGSAIQVARDKGHHDIVKILERGEAVLHAARRGELDTLESLLEKGANVNFCDQYGLTALHVAAIKGNKDAVMMLVEFGADVECRDLEGHTPLHLAVEGGSVETVEVLINRGADLNVQSNKDATPLYISKLMNHQDITQLLVDKGAALVY